MATGRTRGSTACGRGEAGEFEGEDAPLDSESEDEGFSTARWLVQQRELTESMQRLYPRSNDAVELEPPPPARLHLASPQVAMQLARRGQVRSALVVQGCVIWSSNQLLSELARAAGGGSAPRDSATCLSPSHPPIRPGKEPSSRAAR